MQARTKDKSMTKVSSAGGNIVGVDGSDAAKVAVDWAAREAALHRLC